MRLSSADTTTTTTTATGGEEFHPPSSTTATKKKIFVVVAKQQESENPFSLEVQQGCHEEALKRGAICDFRAPKNPTAIEQLTLLREILQHHDNNDIIMSGLAIAAWTDNEEMKHLIQQVLQKGIPVVTFDSDAKSSNRLAYIGTDNYHFGQTLGKILIQLRPDGGNLAVISSEAPNLQERQRGLLDALQQRRQSNNRWKLAAPPTNVPDSASIALEQMEHFVTCTNDMQMNPKVSAMVSVAGWPMYNATRWINLVERNDNITYVIADTFDIQIDLLKRGYVDGLVGQDPYQMGIQTIQVLDRYAANDDGFKYPAAVTSLQPNNNNIYGTAFFEMLRVPLVLPAPDIDHNYVGDLRFLGYTYFGIIAMSSAMFMLWTITHGGFRIVISSQTQFMHMVCVGALIFGMSILFLSFDDDGTAQGYIDIDENETTATTYDRYSTYCMAFPWFADLGFTIMFSALFSKTRCINKAFHNPHPNQRMKVSSKDLYLPLVVFLLANVANMTAWTLIAPLQYVRRAHRGLDDWNRVISYYGSCEASPNPGDADTYIIILIVLNLGALAYAIWQAYEARNIQSEFAESKYIAISMVFILQALLVGAPLLALLRDTPNAFYVALATMIFTICMAVLLLIFIPKVRLVQKLIQSFELDGKKHLESLRIDRRSQQLRRRRRPEEQIGVSDTTILHENTASETLITEIPTERIEDDSDAIVAIEELNNTLESWEVEDGDIPLEMESQLLQDDCMAETNVLESDAEAEPDAVATLDL